MTVLVLVIYVLAVMRVVRLINYDTVLDTPRIAIVKVFGPESKVVYFVTCPWCVGFWVALASAIIPVLIIGWPWWALIGIALATSHLVGAFAGLTADEDMEIEEVVAGD
ncbi:hypothetical protein FDJ57_gp10 [Gordonia phage Sour]|uniref:DUF1360 domain-containing protein n=1 Tax=Gordonia phage Sour TaxID=2182349 RepID=A0A2U8UL52_9CAUD|nr:hypothetical protein FDJ57_gp10 [Gordonia phage Sour]AWN04211.1 hypothetical protein PBI_SOUR_10 [Gordonia phage Sour]